MIATKAVPTSEESTRALLTEALHLFQIRPVGDCVGAGVPSSSWLPPERPDMFESPIIAVIMKALPGTSPCRPEPGAREAGAVVAVARSLM